MNKQQITERQQRIKKVNALIECIGSHGRKFYYSAEHNRYSKIEMDQRGRFWWIDKWNEKRIYMHYKYRWRGFTEGGTLRNFADHLRFYAQHGHLLPRRLFVFPSWHCDGDPWGYGEDFGIVFDQAMKLGMISPEY